MFIEYLAEFELVEFVEKFKFDGNITTLHKSNTSHSLINNWIGKPKTNMELCKCTCVLLGLWFRFSPHSGAKIILILCLRIKLWWVLANANTSKRYAPQNCHVQFNDKKDTISQNDGNCQFYHRCRKTLTIILWFVIKKKVPTLWHRFMPLLNKAALYPVLRWNVCLCTAKHNTKQK